MTSRLEKKLKRQINKYLVPNNNFQNDLQEIEDHFNSILSAEENITSLIEGLPPFLSSVINVYDQYEDKNKMALHNLDLSSKELNDSNRTLELLNNSMKAVLESLGPATFIL